MWSSFRKAKCYVNVRTYRIGSGGRLGAQKTSSFSLATSKEFWEVHSASAWLQEKLLSSCSIPSSPVRWNLLMDSPFLVWFLFKEWKKKKKKRTVFANIFPFDFFPLLEKGYILHPFQVPFRSCWAPGWSFWENQTWLLSIENFCRLSWGLPRAQQCDSSASVEEPRTMHCFRLDIRSCDGGGLMSSVPASIACCVIWGRHLFSYLPFLICKMGKYQCLHQAKY